MKINVLPQSIANMIAAGEVVERPSSVVKELAENSIDAGATSLVVEIKKGGMTYIRITDDGCGIAPDDVVTAFKRHATSKIKEKEDLDAIYTLGFRGEALASIAAVARVDIFTKTKDADFGYSASIEGGEVLDSGEAGCPDGTTITVRDLFFNTPARMKFLKSDATETSYVTDCVHKLILSNPSVAIKLIVNGKTVISSSGDGKLLSAIRSVFGKDYVPHLNPVDFSENGITVTGFVGSNALARKDRRQQVFFINGRYIQSKIVSAALGEAYQNVMMVGKFPVAVISINVSGNFVDVNVHPTKTEVRFSDDKKVYSAIYWAVKNALSAKKYVPGISLPQKNKTEDILSVRKEIAKEQNKSVQMDINLLKDTYIKDNFSKPVSPAVVTDEKPRQEQKNEKKEEVCVAKAIADSIKTRIDSSTFFSKDEISSLREDVACAPCKTSAEDVAPADSGKKEQASGTERLCGHSVSKEETFSAEIVVQPAETSVPEQKSAPVFKANIDFAYVGQIFDTYIIVQKENEMLIIDQHAAHERIYFEELVAEYRHKGIKSQLLMIPVTVDFDPVRFSLVCRNFETFSSLGFECEEFGASSIIVRSVPSQMTDGEIRDVVTEIAMMLEKGNADIKKGLMEDVLHTMACKRAIKGNTKITQLEAESLVEKVLSFESINTCPHGRPIITSMTKYELEKNFKRIV